MKLVFSKRALADLQDAVEYSRQHYGDQVAEALWARFQSMFSRIADAPESAPVIAGRSQMRVVPIGRYPYRIFFRVRQAAVVIVHVRHTSRRDWVEKR